MGVLHNPTFDYKHLGDKPILQDNGSPCEPKDIHSLLRVDRIRQPDGWLQDEERGGGTGRKRSLQQRLRRCTDLRSGPALPPASRLLWGLGLPQNPVASLASVILPPHL
jgi:hypothetical protein